MSKDIQHRIYSTLLQDSIWHKIVIGLHQILIRESENLEKLPFTKRLALWNVRLGFLAIWSVTYRCKDSRLQQQMFDDIFDYIFEYLKEKEVLYLLEYSGSNKRSTVMLISVSMITILQNLSYYHEPSVPPMRAKGLIPLARTIRKATDDSDVKTKCLLIIAYLIDESDDKSIIKITDDELTYLIDELPKTMQSPRTSGYDPEELLDGLNRIAVSDINKLKLIEFGILEILEKSLNPEEKFTPVHRTAAAKAVWNLAFSDESRLQIKERKVLMSCEYKYVL